MKLLPNASLNPSIPAPLIPFFRAFVPQFIRRGGCLCAFILLSGCSHHEADVTVANPNVESMTVAVAPILNFTGRTDFDPVVAADLLASELAHVDGLTILPVNRVVAYLASEGKQQIESPAHALAIAEAVGADAIWVAGITEYDAYTPVVGVVVQVYSASTGCAQSLDVVATSRSASPAQVRQVTRSDLPVSQVQVIYNGMHGHVVSAVKHYADARGESDNPLGWREYLKVQTLFLRFCWHDVIERVIGKDVSPPADSADPSETEQSA